MNTTMIEKLALEQELIKHIEEIDPNDMMTMYFVTSEKWLQTLDGNTVRKWLGYPKGYKAYEELYVYYIYELLVKHENSRIFWGLLEEKYFDEFHEFCTENGYTKFLVQIMDENRPPTEKEGMRL